MRQSRFYYLAVWAGVFLCAAVLFNGCRGQNAKEVEGEAVVAEPAQPSAPVTPVEVVTEEPKPAVEETPAPIPGAPAVEETSTAPEEIIAPPLPPVKEGTRVSEKFPDLATGILAEAVLEELNSGELLSSGDLRITEDMFKEELAKMPEEKREAMVPFSFFLFQDMATKALLDRQVRGNSDAQPGDENWDGLMQAYFEKVTADAKASDDEVAKFYEENKGVFEGAPLEQVKGEIQAYLSQERQQQAIHDHIRNFGKTVGVSVNAPWVQAMAERTKDNLIDKTIAQGKPVLVDFYADWCGPCKRMKPSIEALKETHADKLNVIFVNVDEEPFLANRHKVESIPLLLFYDAQGKLVTRQEGMLEEADLKKELEKIGVS